jgi:hypothetical protein
VLMFSMSSGASYGKRDCGGVRTRSSSWIVMQRIALGGIIVYKWMNGAERIAALGSVECFDGQCFLLIGNWH